MKLSGFGMNIIHLLYMNNIQSSSNKIKKLYGSSGYFNQYGGQVFLFVILSLIVFLVFSYCIVMLSFQPIKDDWANQRCNPKVIPFAGLINKPPGKSISEFTQENFVYCVQGILKSITGDAVQPLTYTTNLLQNLYSNISGDIQNSRGMMNNVRYNTESAAKDVMGRVSNEVTPLQKIIVTFRDFISKALQIPLNSITSLFQLLNYTPV
jgi:hypothetical protein